MTQSREHENDSPINTALRQFEAAEANLEKLERIFREIRRMTPGGISFGSDPKYDDRVRAYVDVLEVLPRIDAWKPEHIPMDLNELGQCRLDAKELGEISAEIAIEEEVEAPARELAQYRHLLSKKRRQLIRSAMLELFAQVDQTLNNLKATTPEDRLPNENVNGALWEKLRTDVQAIEVLLGSSLPRPPHWTDLRRHLSFGMVQDLLDIIRRDWPEAKTGLTASLYHEDEPIPVEVSDLGALATAQPTGRVVTKLKWESLDDETFERLMFSIISSTPGYENPQWLMRTNAPDRGRDLSVTRINTDQLSGTIRSRVLIQCRHWLSRSVSPADVAALKEQISQWEPPKVDVLIIATTGRFSADAVSAIERHNNGDRALRIEMWPETHLERLLAERPSLIAEFGLR